jgi:hypothetical protein
MIDSKGRPLTDVMLEMIRNPAFNDPPEDTSLLPTRLARGIDAEYDAWILDESTRTFSEFLSVAPRVFDVKWCMCDGKNGEMCPHHWEKRMAARNYQSGKIGLEEYRALESRGVLIPTTTGWTSIRPGTILDP